MLRPLTIVVLCALLPWSLCTEECNLQPQAHRCPEILQFQERKFLRTLEGLDLDACKKQCCQSNDCDTVVHEDDHCYLFNCEGVPFAESDSCSFSVFMKPGVPHPHSGYRVEGLMLTPRDTEEEKRDEEEQDTDDEGQKSNNSVCTLPRVVGMCKAAIPRFYFDSGSGSCQRFIYGGCGANGNNFETQEECERICPGGDRVVEEAEAPSEIQMPRSVALKQTEMTEDDFQEQCKAPRVVGLCRAAFPRWFYNETAGQCQRFIYGGCSGNKNNYETEDHCTFNCAGVKLLPSKKKVPAMSEDDKAHCGLAPDSGPCRAAFTMFYFDADSQTCKTFLYGGCRGNNNRYTSDAECQERCGNLGAEGRGQGRNRWTAAFFLLLTLAAVSFLLLTALIVITLRRNRQLPRRALSIRSDKEELLPDSDSLDSLPLPESPKEA